MIHLFYLIFCFVMINANPATPLEFHNETLPPTRRILNGNDVGDTRPYMVYLRAVPTSDIQVSDKNWLCGGVIIHAKYILTSAACIEDVKLFYVVSGTHRWIPLGTQDECITYGAKKAIWKCVPKNYVFDGNEFDNIRWMAGDIAVVKVEDEFNFQRRVRGCDFIPKKIAFNNRSEDMEKAGTVASIAGWGSTEKFSDVATRTGSNSLILLETDVTLLSKKNCKKRWPERYHYIIDDSMICGKDDQDSEMMSNLCKEQEINCKEMIYSDHEDETENRRQLVVDPKHTRRSKVLSGGFCENDHGGPLIAGQGKSSVVIGIISACQTKDVTNKCYGPFLYTSIWRYRNLISCALDKEIGSTCRRLLKGGKTQMSETLFSWTGNSNEPANGKNRNASRI